MAYRSVLACVLLVAFANGALAQTSLTLVPLNGNQCAPPGSILVVELRMLGAPVPVVGGQFYLNYDMAALTYVGGVPGDAPFTREVADLTPSPGTIFYAVGIPDGGSGTAADGVLARLYFHVTTPSSVCGVAALVDFEPDSGPYQTKLSDAFGQPVLATTSPLGPMSFDGTPPTFTLCPAPIVTGSDPAPCCFATVTWPQPTAIDDCGVVSVSQITGPPPGSPFLIGGPYLIEYLATDACGNTALCSFTVTVYDDDPPTIVCPPTVVVPADHGLCTASGVNLGTPTAWDNCGIVSVTNDAPAVFPVGDSTVTWTATDAANLTASCTQTVTVVDTQSPTLVGCPGDIVVDADAGFCSAAVSWTPPLGADNCGPPAVAVNFPPGHVFPLGSTTVTYTATDGASNVTSCSFTVTVNPVSTLVATVELQPNVEPGPFTRCITFELWSCPAALPDLILEQPVTFTNGLSAPVLITIPCGPYSCVTARDKHHTLRQTVTPMKSGPLLVADFTGDPGSGGHWLIGGNLNDDGVIDGADYAIYLSQYETLFGTPDTTCTTAFPHADITGDGLVDVHDFTFIQINATNVNVGTCCGQPVAQTGDAAKGTARPEARPSMGGDQ